MFHVSLAHSFFNLALSCATVLINLLIKLTNQVIFPIALCDIACYCDAVGGMLMVHVTTEPADKEELIARGLQKVMMIGLPTEKPERLSDEEWDRAKDLIQQLNPMFQIVDAIVTMSIVLFTCVLTTEMLQSVRQMYKSGQLTVIVRDLFRCLAMDESLAVDVEITAEEFKQCEDRLVQKGMSVLLFCVALDHTTATM